MLTGNVRLSGGGGAKAGLALENLVLCRDTENQKHTLKLTSKNSLETQMNLWRMF